MNNRSSVLSVVMYLAVAATLVGGIGVALTAVASSVVSQESVARAKTPFEIQLDSARSKGSSCKANPGAPALAADYREAGKAHCGESPFAA